MSKNRTWFLRGLALLALFGLFWMTGRMLSKVAPFEVQKLLAPEHPMRRAYEDYLTKFDDGRSAYILVQKEDGRFAVDEMVSLSKRIGDFLEGNESIQEVVAPHNAKYFSYEGGYFHLVPFVQENQISQESEEKLKSELWRKTLISEDGSSFLVSFSFDSKMDRKKEKPVIDKINLFLEGLKKQNPDIEIHSIGTKIASAAFLGEMGFSLKVITPLLLLLIGVFMYWLYRSWQILVWNYFVMITCYIGTLIFIIAVEDGLGPYSNFALMFSFIVATSDLIHFFCRFQVMEGDVATRIWKAREIAYVPCLLTSLTTAAGFLALIINENLPIRYFGMYCAFACVLEWLMIFHLLPHLLLLFGFNAPRRVIDMERTTPVYLDIISKRARGIVAFSVAFVAIGAAASALIRVDDNFYTKFKSDHTLSRSIDAFAKEFQFVGSIDVLLKPKQGDILDESNLSEVRSFEQEAIKTDQVSRLNSFRQINDALDEEVSKRRDPSSAPVNEVKRSIVNLMTDYGVLGDFYSEQSNELRSVVFLSSLATPDFMKVYQHLNSIKEKYADKLDIEVSGFSSIRNYINVNVIKNFFESFILSFFLMYLCFLYLYRHPLWAFIALLPNALPLVVISGLLGLFSVPVDSNLAILICVAFGISGDNTIHLTYVTQQNSDKNLSYRDNLRMSIKQIGVPIVASSAIFVFCLPVFLLGDLKLFGQMAIFLSLSFVMAFFSDMFSFPAFNMLLKKNK